jgi:hypothetical protein
MSAAIENLDDVEWLPADDTRGLKQVRSARRWHLAVLAVAVGVGLLAVSLIVLPDGRIAFKPWPQYSLPEACAMQARLHIRCPGCGLTRSFIHLAHGRVEEAVAMNPVGVLIAVLLAIQIPYRLWMLWRPGSLVWSATEITVACVTPLVLLWLQWGVRLWLTGE